MKNYIGKAVFTALMSLSLVTSPASAAFAVFTSGDTAIGYAIRADQAAANAEAMSQCVNAGGGSCVNSAGNISGNSGEYYQVRFSQSGRITIGRGATVVDAQTAARPPRGIFGPQPFPCVDGPAPIRLTDDSCKTVQDGAGLTAQGYYSRSGSTITSGHGSSSSSSGGGGGGSSSTGAVIGGLVAVVGVLWLVSELGFAENQTMPVAFYSNNNGVLQYEVGFRKQWARDNWSSYVQATRVRNDNDATFSVVSGLEYTGKFGEMSFKNSGQGEQNKAELLVSGNKKFGVWNVSPFYQVEHETGAESSWLHNLKLGGSWKVNDKMTVSPSVGFAGSSLSDLSDNNEARVLMQWEF